MKVLVFNYAVYCVLATDLEENGIFENKNLCDRITHVIVRNDRIKYGEYTIQSQDSS